MTLVLKEQLAQEALQAMTGHQRCGAAVTMGGGKTYIGLLHMARNFHLDVRYLVVAPKKDIFKTWKEEAQKHHCSYLLSHITFVTYRSLPRQPHCFDVVYLDECHSLLYVHGPWLSRHTGAIIGLTGTPPRHSQSEKGTMVARFCPIVYSYVTDEAIADGMLNDYRIIIHHLALGTSRHVAMKNRNTGGTWYQSEENVYLFWHKKVTELETALQQLQQQRDTPKQPATLSTRHLCHREAIEQQCNNLSEQLKGRRIMRMRALMDFPGKVNYARWLLRRTRNKTMVFANTKEQADSLCPYSYHYANPLSEANLELFNSGEIHQLASILRLNEGINVRGLREGIILHGYGNERKSAQRTGRLLRLNPDDRALLHLLCYDGTVDEGWVKDALQDFDPEKIYHYYPSENGLFDTYGRPVDGLEMPWGFYHPPAGFVPVSEAFRQPTLIQQT